MAALSDSLQRYCELLTFRAFSWQCLPLKNDCLLRLFYWYSFVTVFQNKVIFFSLSDPYRIYIIANHIICRIIEC